MPDPLDAARVRTREEFLRFVRALIADRKVAVVAEAAGTSHASRDPEGDDWENTTIERFLEGALAWAEDTRMGETQGLTALGEPSWEAFAAFLYCGKIYE